MQIYSVSTDFDKFDSCLVDYDASAKIRPTDGPEWDMMIDFGGMRQGDKWWPRVMELDHRKKTRLGDYVSKLDGDVMILEKKAIEKLYPIMGEVEILPLICDFGDYWAVNILNVLDCIDYDKSEFVWLNEEEHRIMYFKKYVFRSEQIEGHHLFKIIDLPKSAIFVDDIFVDLVKKCKITGFSFKPVWDARTGR